MARFKNPRNPFITLSHFLHFLSFSNSNCITFIPKKYPRQQQSNHTWKLLVIYPNLYYVTLFFLFLLSFFVISKIHVLPISQHSTSCSSIPYSSSSSTPFSSLVSLFLTSCFAIEGKDVLTLSERSTMPLPTHGFNGNMTEEEQEFWRQPDGAGYRPCIKFGIGYRKASVRITKEKMKFLMVVVSGGLNQQRNQIVDAVVIARILGAALVVPILEVNHIWEDESKFSDIFDVDHFKRTLKTDVRIVNSLPPTHLIPRYSFETKIPANAPPLWIRSKFTEELKKEGVLLLKGLDSKLSKNLPLDLQKLRCKVAFHALRFVAPIQELGNRMAMRIWIDGPYIALHLRLEKDVWIRTGCLPGLGPEYDDIVTKERESLVPLYGETEQNISYYHRKLAGHCPLTGFEVARLLKALGAPRSARVYLAGGEPFGGERALRPLKAEFPKLIMKEMLALEGELEPFVNSSSALTAIDYLVSLSSDVFMPSHGGNMGRAMQGHRAYAGHRKYITPNKRAMLPLFAQTWLSNAEFNNAMKRLHRESVGQPELRTHKRDRNVIAYPVPECMCKRRTYLLTH